MLRTFLVTLTILFLAVSQLNAEITTASASWDPFRQQWYVLAVWKNDPTATYAEVEDVNTGDFETFPWGPGGADPQESTVYMARCRRGDLCIIYIYDASANVIDSKSFTVGN